MGKIKLSFDSANYQKELSNIIEIGKKATVVQEYILKITNDNVNAFDLEAVNEWIKSHYNFINVEQVMKLQNQDVIYDFVKNFLLTIEPSVLDSLSLQDGIYKPTKKCLKTLNEKFTSYCEPEFEEIYKDLKQVQDSINKCDRRFLKAMLIQTEQGINLNFNRFESLQGAYKRNLI